jgi:Lysozyme like domain/Ricin-type beta-trefoil lectin domain
VFAVSAATVPGHKVSEPRHRAVLMQPRPARPGVIPAALPVRLTDSELATAAWRCAAWAARAGFPNTDVARGRLTTAVAVALAQTGCDPTACYDNTTRRACTQASGGHAANSVYRGAWQVGGRARTGVSDACAFQGRCNARAAYQQVAGFGTDFRPWTAYQAGRYRGYLPAAARAVGRLDRGALPSAVTGLCAEYVVDRPGAWTWLARCGRGSVSEQWVMPGQQLKTENGLCLTAAGSARAGAPQVTIERCTGSAFQDWLPRAGFTLYNAGARQCLTAPGSPAQRGTTLSVRPCADRRGQRWFRP